MDWWLISFIFGAIASLFLPTIPDIVYLIITAAVTFTVCLYSIKHLAYRTILSFLLGALVVLFHGYQYNHSLNFHFGNDVDIAQRLSKPLLVSGEVLTLPTSKQMVLKNDNSTQLTTYKFNFLIKAIAGELVEKPFIVRLSWQQRTSDLKPMFDFAKQLKQGQIWQLQVKLKPSHGLANLGGFNYQTWLRAKEIVATGYVKSVAKKAGDEQSLNKLLLDKVSIRQQLFDYNYPLIFNEDRIKGANTDNVSADNIDNQPLKAILLALSFGERSEISQQTWQVLQTTGTSHLIAISGLHLGLVATASFLFFSWVFGQIANLKFLPAFQSSTITSSNYRLWAIISSCCLSLFYAYLAGFSLPTVRALIMLFLFWGSRLSGVYLSPLRLLLLTVVLTIFLIPMSLLSAGFWLSFSAVMIIFSGYWLYGYFFKHSGKLSRWFASLVFLQVLLSVLMLPMVAFFSASMPLLSLVANIVAVPFISITCIPLCLLAVIVSVISTNLATMLFNLAELAMASLWQWLSFIAELPFSSLQLTNQQFLLLLIIFAFFLMLVWFITVKPQHRKRNSLYLIPLLVAVSGVGFHHNQPLDKPALKEASWQVFVLDVGQGLAVVIERNKQAVLYDTGASYPSGFNMADAAILPFIKHQGIDHFEHVIISHSDNDHSGSLAVLQNSGKVKHLIANNDNFAGDMPCVAGTSFNWEDLTFMVLSPDKFTGSDNDDSCVIQVSDGKHRVLLTGDISKKVEKHLVNNTDNNYLKSDILIPAHHGSNSSSLSVFINAVEPEFVVFSAGFLNRWHMPSKKVLTRFNAYQEHSAQTVHFYNTAYDGMVRLTINEAGIKAQSYRQNIMPFWFARHLQ